MTTAQLYDRLNDVDSSRENRLEHADLVLKDPHLIPKLIEIVFMVDDKISCKAAWVLEFVCNENLKALLPYLDTFTENLSKVYFDSAVRPVAKICEMLAKAFYSKENNSVKSILQFQHKEKIIEYCFDIMINDEKIAPKAYAMQTLFLLGKDFDWIHLELVQILEHDFPNQSAGFKARAKHLIKKIKSKSAT